ncbi:MAG: hypothetical protein WAV15_01135 [Minisyncoccia bacterium]
MKRISPLRAVMVIALVIIVGDLFSHLYSGKCIINHLMSANLLGAKTNPVEKQQSLTKGPVATTTAKPTPSLFKVKVLTVEGQPVFYVPDSYTAEDIDRAVDSKFGLQPNGSGHNWYGGD